MSWSRSLCVAAVALLTTACASGSEQPDPSSSADTSSGAGASGPTSGSGASSSSASAGGDGGQGGSPSSGGGGGQAGSGSGGGGQGGGPMCPPAPSAPPDLVAWYRFDDPTNPQVVDSSSYGHHGTASAGVQRGVAGRHCYGVRFDGNLSNIDVPYSTQLDITGDITIEAWVFLDAPISTNRMLVRKALQYQMSVSIAPQPNLLEFYSQPLGFARASNPVEFGKWIHAAVSHDGTTARLYINGELVDAIPHAGSLPSNNTSLKLGGDGFNQVAPDGGMDDVMVWKVLRTDQQVCEDGEGTYNPSGTPKCTY